MRKHYKLISSIVCLLLCVSMIAFGVYAATHSLIGVSSQVSFTPTTAKLKIFGGIRGQDGYNSTESGAGVGYKQTYYACNYNNTDLNAVSKNVEKTQDGVDYFNPWEYGSIHFDKDYDEATGPTPIYFYIQVTNYVQRDINYKIVIDKLTQKDTAETDLFGTHINLDYSSYIQNNEQTFALNDGWWDISKQEKSNVTFTEKTDLTYTDFQKNADGKIETSISGVVKDDANKEPATTMIVIRLKVNNTNADDSFDFNFNFTLTAI